MTTYTMVREGQIIAKGDTLTKVGEMTGEFYVANDEYTVRDATAADAAIPVSDFTPYYVKEGDTYVKANRAGDTGKGFTDKAGVAQKVNKVTNVMELFEKPSLDMVFEPPKEMKIVVAQPTPPGLVSKAVASSISTELKALCTEVMGGVEPDLLTGFFMNMMQLLLTYSTSPDTEDKEEYYTVVGSGGEKNLTYEKVKGAIMRGAHGSNYENPLRQYARLFSSTVVHLILNGKLSPNEKVSMQHGVPRRFLPYTFDFCRPSYLQFSNDAIRAWQLATETAFSRKAKVTSNVLHNTADLKGA